MEEKKRGEKEVLESVEVLVRSQRYSAKRAGGSDLLGSLTFIAVGHFSA